MKDFTRHERAEYRCHGPARRLRGAGVAAKGNLVKKIAIGIVLLLVLIQALYVVQAQPGELITGLNGMADLLARSVPPNVSNLQQQLYPALETIDIGIFGTFFAVTSGAASGHSGGTQHHAGASRPMPSRAA